MRVYLLLAIAAAWNYGSQGSDWGDNCQSGEGQSPINIDTGDTSKLSSDYQMTIYYYGKTCSRTVMNDGNVVYMNRNFGCPLCTSDQPECLSSASSKSSALVQQCSRLSLTLQSHAFIIFVLKTPQLFVCIRYNSRLTQNAGEVWISSRRTPRGLPPWQDTISLSNT